MSMNTNNIPMSKSNATEWQYSNDGSWDYNSESFTMKVENVFNTSIDKDKLQATVNGRKLDDSTLYGVFDANQDGKLTLSELSTVTKAMPVMTTMPTTTAMPTTTTMPTTTAMPTTTTMPVMTTMPTTTAMPVTMEGGVNYGSDGQFTYNIEKFTKNLEKQTGLKIDREKLRTSLGIEFTDQKTITDRDVYNSLDANKDGKLTKSELGMLVVAEPEQKPKAEIKYGSDKQYSYNLDSFAKNIEKQTGTEIDQEKLRALLGIKFGDQENITDFDIYDNFDTNGDLVLDNTEIMSIVDKTKKMTAPSTLDAEAVKALVEKTIKDMLPAIIEQILKEIMKQQAMPQMMTQMIEDMIMQQTMPQMMQNSGMQ